jgi:hypothetical protein
MLSVRAPSAAGSWARIRCSHRLLTRCGTLFTATYDIATAAALAVGSGVRAAIPKGTLSADAEASALLTSSLS